METIYSHYAVVYCQCYSPCRNFLVTGNNYGFINLFSLPVALAPNADKESWLPYYKFKASRKEIFCLISTDDYLISGDSLGDISAFKWADIHNKTPKVAWHFTLPQEVNLHPPEVNALAICQNEQESELAAGGGDNVLYIWDIESGNLKIKLSGHTDYIHDIKLREAHHQYVTASEDGSVRLWDSRSQQEPVHIIEPHKEERCQRKKMGKFISCLDVDPSDEWLVCGGGPSLSTWHLRSLMPTTIFETPSVCQSHVQFYEDTIISAGTEAFVNHWYRNGDVHSRIPCTPSSVCSVAINEKSSQYKVLTVAGSSPYVDVCTNFSYTSLQLYHQYKP